MKNDKMCFENFFAEDGATGKVIYDEFNDVYELNVNSFNIGLQSNGWQEFEGKKINIKVTILEEDGS